MDELEKIRQKKLAELRETQQKQVQEEAQAKQQIAQLEAMVKPYLTKDALSRFGNIKAAHPEKAIQVLVILGQAIQEKQIQKVDDNTLKQILMNLTQQKKDFKIKKI